MKESELTESELLKKAFSIGWRLKMSGLDPETIYARLEKEGVPEHIAIQAVKDMQVQNKKDFVEHVAKPNMHTGYLRAAVGVIAGLVSLLIFPDNILIPAGTIIGGLAYALWWKYQSED